MKYKHSTIICSILLLGSVFGLCGCDRVYRMLDKEGAEEKELIGEIIPFEQNARVYETQSLLKVYGYNVGTPDGILGLHTRNAIEKFQKDSGLKPSRFIDFQTWSYIKVPVERGLIVDYALDVAALQTALQIAGFSPGRIDGKFGKKTAEAVESFQESKGLHVDGKVGYRTLLALSEYIQG